MMITKKMQILYPSSFLQELAIPFNGVIGMDFVSIKSTTLQINFPNRGADNHSMLLKLIEKLVQSFSAINEKYQLDLDRRKNIRITIDASETHNIIIIRGILRIPPGKLFKLFSLILWYFISYMSGAKPSASTYGTELTKKWNEEYLKMSHHINKLPRKIEVSYETMPCHICGEPTNASNVWRFSRGQNSGGILLKTRICIKHRNLLI